MMKSLELLALLFALVFVVCGIVGCEADATDGGLDVRDISSSDAGADARGAGRPDDAFENDAGTEDAGTEDAEASSPFDYCSLPPDEAISLDGVPCEPHEACEDFLAECADEDDTHALDCACIDGFVACALTVWSCADTLLSVSPADCPTETPIEGTACLQGARCVYERVFVNDRSSGVPPLTCSVDQTETCECEDGAFVCRDSVFVKLCPFD